jgi:hypothetical protein
MTDPVSFDLEPGQVWTYHGALDADSRVIIGRIDLDDHDAIVSVAVSFARSQQAASVGATDIGHLPIRRAALVQSLHSHVGNGSLPDHFDEGYSHWRDLYDKGRAGAFGIDVAKAIDFALCVKETGTRR